MTSHILMLLTWLGSVFCNAAGIVAGRHDDAYAYLCGEAQSLLSVTTAVTGSNRAHRKNDSDKSSLSISGVRAGLVPLNDDVCNAQPLALCSPFPFDASVATVQPGEVSPPAGTGTSSCNSQDGWCSFEIDVQNSLWYSFSAPASGCVIIRTSDGPDMQLALYTADNCNDFDTFTLVSANDDGGTLTPVFEPRIENSCLTPGAEYLVQLDGFSGNPGSGTIHVNECPAPAATIDVGECQTRLVNGLDDNPVNYLFAQVSGVVGPASYLWEVDNGDADSILSGGSSTCATVTPEETTEYVFTVSQVSPDYIRCFRSASVTVEVVDVICQNNSNKINMCHVPQGNPGNKSNICISRNAVDAHLRHKFDYVGPCELDCTAQNTACPSEPPCVARKLRN